MERVVNGAMEYRVQWLNFASSANTWEPVGNLTGCAVLMAAYEAQINKVKMPKGTIDQITNTGRLHVGVVGDVVANDKAIRSIQNQQRKPRRRCSCVVLMLTSLSIGVF
jgi:hypothetical protein